MSGSDSDRIAAVLRLLTQRYGYLEWWKSDPEGVIIGAVLTQQTRWENVEAGLRELEHRNLRSLDALARAPREEIEEAIRCTGFFRVKSRRLQDLASMILHRYGDVTSLARADPERVRKDLLSVRGVGEETADCILCYGLDRCALVLDRYTRRICTCAGIHRKDRELRILMEVQMPRRNEAYRQAHARFVEYGKEVCGKNRCDTCGIARLNG